MRTRAAPWPGRVIISAMGWCVRALAGVMFFAGLGLSGDAQAQSKMVVVEQPAEARPQKEARVERRSQKARKTRTRRSTKRAQSKRAMATYPGFRMLPDGTSEVWVHLSKSVSVETRFAAGRTTLMLANTRVRTWNNTHPLVTTHFNTPVSSVRLRRGKKGTSSLTINLRETAKLAVTTLPGPRGTMFLRVAIPKARRNYVPSHERVPVAGRYRASSRRAGKPVAGSGDLTKGLERKLR